MNTPSTRPSTAVSRRWLLTSAAATGVVSSARVGLSAAALGASQQAAAEDDYRALVCVFLYGGSDSVNMYVPATSAGYAGYADSRRLLRVPREDLLLNESELGFNSRLPRMSDLFNRGNLAVVRNVGNLVERTSRAQVLAQGPGVPLGLFAHDYQQEQWQKGYSSQPSTLVGSGWGGRMADRLRASNDLGALSPNISVFGNNFWIAGNAVAPVSVHPVRGLERLNHLDSEVRAPNSAREATLDALFAARGDHPMKDQVTRDFRRAKAYSRVVSQALRDSPAFETPYNPGNTVAAQLRMVARLIAARDLLGVRRQVYFVGFGGWDTHGGQAGRLNALLSGLDEGMSSFHDTLEEMAIGSQVTTFTASDFGRSLSINGDGTDHGWGGHYMVMGGAVEGGTLYGEMPDYALGSADDAGEDGRLIPTTSINQYGAIMARWLGLDDAALRGVFPDLVNFGPTWDDGLRFMAEG